MSALVFAAMKNESAMNAMYLVRFIYCEPLCDRSKGWLREIA